VSSSSDASSGPLSETPARRAPTWPRAAVIVAVLVLAFIVSRTAGETEVTQADAVATAAEQVDFVPEDTQVRLLRQGIDRHPYWIVSLSTPSPDGQTYDELAVVRIDAETGKVVEFREQRDAPRGSDQAP
jgi:hypothetical protein